MSIRWTLPGPLAKGSPPHYEPGRAEKRKRPETTEVFRLLHLETEVDRQRLRQLARLGQVGTAEVQVTSPWADTRNNTRREEDDAQLEPDS